MNNLRLDGIANRVNLCTKQLCIVYYKRRSNATAYETKVLISSQVGKCGGGTDTPSACPALHRLLKLSHSLAIFTVMYCQGISIN